MVRLEEEAKLCIIELMQSVREPRVHDEKQKVSTLCVWVCVCVLIEGFLKGFIFFFLFFDALFLFLKNDIILHRIWIQLY